MMLRVFTGRFTQAAERMSVVAVGLGLMILANILLVAVIWSKDHTVVMVPPGLADVGEISSGRATESVLGAWGLATANLVGNATPKSMPLVLETLQEMMVPSSYQVMTDSLTRQARELQLDQLSLSFSAHDVRVDPTANKVSVTGVLTTYGLRNQRTSEERTYEMVFDVKNYAIRLAALSTYKGRPSNKPKEAS